MIYGLVDLVRFGALTLGLVLSGVVFRADSQEPTSSLGSGRAEVAAPDITSAMQAHLDRGELDQAWALFRATPRSNRSYGEVRDLLAEWVPDLSSMLESSWLDACRRGDMSACEHWQEECHFLDPHLCQSIPEQGEVAELGPSLRPPPRRRLGREAGDVERPTEQGDQQEKEACKQVELLLMAARATEQMDRAQANVLYQRCRSPEFQGCRLQSACSLQF